MLHFTLSILNINTKTITLVINNYNIYIKMERNNKLLIIISFISDNDDDILNNIQLKTICNVTNKTYQYFSEKIKDNKITFEFNIS